MSKARNISNLFSSATDLATDAEVVAAIASKANLSGGNTFSGVQTLESASEWPLISRFSNSVSSHRNHILMQRSNNGSAVTSGFTLGGLAISGHDGTNYGLGWNGGVEITAYAAETWTSSARGTNLVFSNTPIGTTSLIERMRITSQGKLTVGVGTIYSSPPSTIPNLTLLADSNLNDVATNAFISARNKNNTNAITITGGILNDTYRDIADPHYSAGMWFIREPYSGNASTAGSIVFGTGFNVNQSAFPTERMRINSNGDIGIGNSSPTTYNTSGGKVVNITGTALNSGPSTIMQIGNSGTQGAGYAATEVFAIANITSAQEITRVTGTNANGFRAYFKIIVTGHTGTIGNGTNIKEFYWDGGTNAPVQISTYTANNVPPITFDTTVSNRLVVLLASSNGSAGFNGVMKVEWMLPIDFASSTYTLS